MRRLTPDDLDAVEALDADPAVMRYITGGRPTPRDELRDAYEALNRSSRHGSASLW